MFHADKGRTLIEAKPGVGAGQEKEYRAGGQQVDQGQIMVGRPTGRFQLRFVYVDKKKRTQEGNIAIRVS